MYTAEVTGHYRFVQNGLFPPPCACQRCVHFEYLGHNHGGGGGGGGAQTSRQGDHPALDRTRLDLWAKDPTRTSLGSSRLERSCHRSPQRRPVFVGTVPCNRAGPVCSYEIPPAHCNCNARHCPPLREQCRCMHSNSRVYTFGVPHQLPHLQVKDQGYKLCKTVRYASIEDEDYVSDRSSFEPQHSPQMGYIPNGHCGIGAFGVEGVEERDTHQDWDRTQPERSEQGCNGHGGFYKGFFTTEVPPKHFNPNRRRNGSCLSSAGGTQSLKSNGVMVKREQSPEPGEQRRKDTVREQIRQVVTNLEDVLGGLKQVHVEMREVVQQIDRLTANIDLSEETPSITPGPENNNNCVDFSEDLRVVAIGNHRPQMAQHVDEERIILRTNSPSPIHTASVVKTNRIVPFSKQNGLKNGHPPQFYNSNHMGHTILGQETPHPQALDPKVIIESRTQKPPPYPQNGRCGKYQAPVKPARTPSSNLGRGRQSSSMV
ncbi:uncharacterized protein LOC110164133 [Boleophthalmus pectinirostris]|uniref:uncharacterized protein LOC110164133 n=1 Tax=Boleophthalmus pectinirostris TaxID=150288 RepID=UPI00242DDCD7|nr:uncharacterized protein LOC110164133 [Boleophthalmus pectinirostris]XP_055007604.1 uncharacterized protein LOC110164133 [Boleophthalmus pectinirostris]XP_055007605.1 uncharacterized protein LOC110164133 [Boleophthalmus pectinirostris]XP_055007606.1 uncharacterized protein LOC110164133 [Boleophthalmus pectinirostris]XP_055007607.1 uncharacterized protein LOC110164133 [Boleophthalmus pectinirostris]